MVAVFIAFVPEHHGRFGVEILLLQFFLDSKRLRHHKPRVSERTTFTFANLFSFCLGISIKCKQTLCIFQYSEHFKDYIRPSLQCKQNETQFGLFYVKSICLTFRFPKLVKISILTR